MPISDKETIRELIADLEHLVGVHGQWRIEPRANLQTPDQIKELARDLLTELFGLEVRGL
jgi:hypothetical protein